MLFKYDNIILHCRVPLQNMCKLFPNGFKNLKDTIGYIAITGSGTKPTITACNDNF